MSDTAAENLLPSWRPGPTRDALLAFLEASSEVPVRDRVAYFDNDGTMWTEKPEYMQMYFFMDALKRRVEADPTLAERAEYAALIQQDMAAIGKLGLPAIVFALAELFEGQTPAEFAAEARDFASRHPGQVFVPMLELMDELRSRDFTVGIITGGGTEFVRAISEDLYGVPPELVVGSLIDYTFARGADGTPELRRTAQILGHANEGEPKVLNIQTQLGRRPIFAAGNSSGDREMLEWAAGGPGPTLALLVVHDDAEREAAYVSEGVTTANDESITDVGARLGWTLASIKDDWATVF